MKDETELKFEVPKESLGQLKASRWFKENRRRRAKNEKLVSVYFDTDNLKLRRKGVSLRVRHIGEARVQTIKAEGQSTAGLFSRQEWEHRIKGDEPDLKAAAGTPLQGLFKKKSQASSQTDVRNSGRAHRITCSPGWR